MKNLVVIMAVSMMCFGANAVTPSKKSTKAPAPIAETKVEDPKLVDELEAELAKEAPAPAPTAAAPAAPQEAQGGELTLDDDAAVAKEIEAIEAQQSSTRVQNKKKNENNLYVSGSVGMLAYPGVGNATGKYAGDLAFGYIWDKTIMIQVGLGYGQMERNEWDPAVFNRTNNYLINQFTATLGAKYRMAFGKVVPTLGAVVGQTQRQKTRRDPFNSGDLSQTRDAGTSVTTDAGVTAGVDFELNKEFAIGLDLKYMFNVSNAEPAQNTGLNPNYAKPNQELLPIEKLESYTAGVSARMNF